MTEYNIKVQAALEQFSQLIAGYGLEADRSGNSCWYPIDSDLSYSVLTFYSKVYPAKGNKKLMDRLEDEGFYLWKFWGFDPYTGRRVMKFFVYKNYPIRVEKDVI
ncbi:MAG: hypothetical protein ACI4P4_03780 [Faecousia sp.]